MFNDVIVIIVCHNAADNYFILFFVLLSFLTDLRPEGQKHHQLWRAIDYFSMCNTFSIGGWGWRSDKLRMKNTHTRKEKKKDLLTIFFFFALHVQQQLVSTNQ